MQITVFNCLLKTIKARQEFLTSLLCFCPLLFLVLFSISSCSKKEKALFFSGDTMGTTYHITLVPDADNQSQKLTRDELEKGITNALSTVNQSMSTYIPTSELSVMNDDQTGDWLPVSSMMVYVLSDALTIAHLTDDALDITVGPLVNLWGFGPKNAVVSAPTDEDIQRVENFVGLKKIQFDLPASRLKKPVGMRIDLSSIAKGYGADVIAYYLHENGFQNYLIEVGGEIVTKGVNVDGNEWRIGVEKPALGHQGVQQAIAVSGRGVATSGDYRNYFEQNGVRFSHIIDPRTGYPVKNNLASVTVIAETGAMADGLATAFTVLGEEKTFELAKQHDIPVYAIIRREDGFVAEYSDAFRSYLDESTE